MMKMLRFILIGFVFGFVLVAAFAGEVVKLIGVDQGATNSHVAVDIIGDSIILGGHILAHNMKNSFATIFTWDAKSWKRTAELHPGDRDPATLDGRSPLTASAGGASRTMLSSGHCRTMLPALSPARLISTPAAGRTGNSR